MSQISYKIGTGGTPIFSSMTYDMNSKVTNGISIDKAVFKLLPSSAYPFAFFMGNVKFSISPSDKQGYLMKMTT